MRHEPLVEVWRDGLPESVHYGSLVVLGPDGAVRFALGEIDAPCYPRSTAKLMQAVGLVRLGLDLPPDLLALAAASHSGEEFQLAGARRILDTCGLTEHDLGNPESLPYEAEIRDVWLAAGRPARKLAHCCSGKHAAMLAVARAHGSSTADYLDPGHPLQRALADTVEDLTGEHIACVAVDGCRAPLFAVSLRGLARAAGRIAAAPAGSPERRVARAIRRHPEMLAGPRRDVTRLMTAVPGLIAKDGVEAVQVVGLPDGTAIALKIADGGDRARMPATLAALSLTGTTLPGPLGMPDSLRATFGA
ncbi:MAG TPA: asparaginase [Amycolatopsis sp.]|uniref:asparaginase n=1 Tax=Amycolatopsis sp. TaxID=37632 RepID=UPI002B4AA7B0|nr:asparaginase [Amycolatopsis sp.]HKS48884.1 asparaginase [Amycolatopsis sp.]